MAFDSGLTHTGAKDTFRYTNSRGGLTQLILDGYSDMRSLEPLQVLGSFCSFSMKDCGAQDPWLESLSYLTSLTHLDLSSNQDLSDQGMEWLGLRTTLRILAIQDLPNLTLPGLSSLAPLTDLNKLYITLPDLGLEQTQLRVMPAHLQQAIAAAESEVPSLFKADISNEID